MEVSEDYIQYKQIYVNKNNQAHFYMQRKILMDIHRKYTGLTNSRNGNKDTMISF